MALRTEYSRTATVHGLFVEAALMNPDVIAVQSETESLTYAGLLARSQGIAASLRRRGVGSGTMVGLAAERSCSTVAAMLGILMAGGIYVPLELKGSPSQLLQRQVRASGLSLLLCDQSFHRKDWPQPWWRGCELFQISHLENELLPAGSDFVPVEGSAHDPAYVMFTSGSTGQPKGVVVPHRGIVRLVSAQTYLEFGPDETFLLHSPLGFDASTLEIWGSLLHGARLAIAPARSLSLTDYEAQIASLGVTTLWLSASVFHLLADHAMQAFAPLRQLIVGGDVVSPPRVERTLRTYPSLHMVNGYGPTENTTFTACYRVPANYRAENSLPIGKAIHATTAYVVDAERRLVPDGAVGELAAGGDGVALGYIDAPAATEAKFIDDPFASDRSARMYLTGDRVRRLPDGNLEFLGRMDQEVKIAGRRIDLKEVEENLRSHPLVEEAVVLAARDDSAEKRLVAFVKLQQGQSAAVQMLHEFLNIRIPSVAIPSRFVLVDALPLNANGKIDRDLLLSGLGKTVPRENVGAKKEKSKTTAEPANPLELVLGIWRRLLRRDDIQTEDNFFDVGGTSLLLMELHIELNKAFPGKLSLMDLFAATTVRKISDRLGNSRIGNERATLTERKA